MSPKESWLRLAQMGPIHMEKREYYGTNLRDIDADVPDYHGIPITNNMPILRGGRAFDGLGHSGAFFVFTL